MDNNVNKATFSILAILSIIAAAVAAKVRAAYNTQLPEGYEDEYGFHYGTPDRNN